jgi:hypothetical protein
MTTSSINKSHVLITLCGGKHVCGGLNKNYIFGRNSAIFHRISTRFVAFDAERRRQTPALNKPTPNTSGVEECPRTQLRSLRNAGYWRLYKNFDGAQLRNGYTYTTQTSYTRTSNLHVTSRRVRRACALAFASYTGSKVERLRRISRKRNENKTRYFTDS